MPKGVYNRSKVVNVMSEPIPTENPVVTERGINKVRVSQMPDRQSANANVESVLQTHGGDEISTSERLFGDIAERDQLDKVDPNRTENLSQDPLNEPEKEIKEPEEPKPQEFNQQPEESKPIEDDFIDWEKMQNKKIRQKIDGKEVVITAEELKKYSDQDQIKKHLADAADKVGQERRKLAEERQRLEEFRNQRQGQYQAPIENGTPAQTWNNAPVAQNQDPVFQRIQFLEAQIQQLAQGVQPSIYESNRQRVANELKGQGFNDFLDYLPKMESIVIGMKDPDQVKFYDTPEGSKALYFQLKAQDLQKAPVRQIQVQNVPRGIPPQTTVDSGSQPSGNFNDDADHNYRAAFRKATNLGDDREAWNDVLRKKGIIPD